MELVYLDNAATTQIDEEVLEQMLPYFKNNYGNASSIYKLGRTSKIAINEARKKVAQVLNADEDEIYFTSGGSESNNLFIKGVAHKNKNKKHIITTRIEHPSVLETCKTLEKEGYKITYLNVDKDGLIDLKELESNIKEETSMITIMFANNEIGTIQAIKEIGIIARKYNVIFHTDAVQAIGTLKIDVKEMNLDGLSLSAHKFYGPKGIGVLYIKKGIPFQKLIDGGHQENNKRSGTENVPAIVGLGYAIEKSSQNLEDKNKKIQELRDYYIKEVIKRIPYVQVNGSINKRLPGNANISFKYIEGESLLLKLDLKNICASSGSACTSKSLEPSHVLLAIGLPHEIAHGSLRISIGYKNTKAEIDYLINSLVEIVRDLRTMSPLYEKV